MVVSIPYIIAAVSSLKSGIYHLPAPRYLELSNKEWVQLLTLAKIFNSENGDLQSQFNQVNSVYWTLAIEFQFYLCIYVALIFRKYFYSVISTITVIILLLIAYPQNLNAGFFIHFWPMFAMVILLYYVIESGLTLEKMFVHNSRLVAAIIVVMLISAITFLSYLGVLNQLLDRIFPSSDLGFALISSCLLWFAAPLETVLEDAKNGRNLIFRCLIKTGAFLGLFLILFIFYMEK